MVKLTGSVLSEESSVFLNFVRFAACEMVVFGHFLTKYQPVPYDSLFILGSTLGGVAVLLFFVLSGLLVSYSLLRKAENPQYGFRSYFVDRFSRIYSGLIPALLLSAVIAALIYVTNYSYYAELSSMQSAPSLQTFTLTFFMLERFPVGFFNSLVAPVSLSFPLPEVTPFGFNGILWTLVVEWWIYMFFGALVIGSHAIMGRRQKTVLYKASLIVAATLLGLLLVGFGREFGGVVAAWFFGALIFLALYSASITGLFSSIKAKIALKALFVACLPVAGLAVYGTYAWSSDFYNVYLGLALSACVFVTVLLLNAGGLKQTKPAGYKQTAKTVNFVAGYSYTLFLTHYPLIILLNGLDLGVNRWIMLIPVLLLTNIMAFGIAYFTEKRSQQLKCAIKKLAHLILTGGSTIHRKSPKPLAN